MRVLNVNMSVDSVTGGGTAERTLQITRALIESGNECDILTLSSKKDDARASTADIVRLIALKCYSARFYLPALQVKKIAAAVKRADVVHLMNHWTVLNALVYLIAVYLKKPYVVCPAGALPIFGRSRLLKKLYNVLIGKRIILGAAGHIAIAKDEFRQFEEYGIEPNRISLIPNGVNIEDFKADDGYQFRRKYGLKDHPFILFVGRLNYIKGPDLLLQAFNTIQKEYQNWHLVFAGPDNGMLSELVDFVAKSGLEERVHFIGYIGGAVKSQAYHAADLVVIPSRQEAMSIVVLEAGITGTPVLLSDQCGFDEVEEIRGGKVVSANIEGLSIGLTLLLSDHEKLKIMGQQLRNHAAENYTWNNAAQRYLEMYKDIVDVNN